MTPTEKTGFTMKRALHIAVLVVFAAAAGSAATNSPAQSYPAKAVRIVVPYSTGSATDVMTRIIALKLTDIWGQQVLVDNQPGANGIPGTANVAKSAPDGHMLIMIAANHVVNASLYSRLPFDTVKDFRPIARIGQVPFVLCVPPAFPVRSLKEFVALAKRRPGEIDYASPGNGTPGHLAMELLKTMAGIKVVHVPYKGAATALTDVLGGQVPASFIVVAAAIPHIKNRKLIPLAVSSARRSPQLPEVASVDELGYKGFDIVSWIGIAGPARIPNEVVNKVSSDVLKIVSDPLTRDRIVGLGIEMVPVGPAEFGPYVASEHAKWGKIVKASGAKLD